MSMLQKLSGFAKTFRSALLTRWQGFSDSGWGKVQLSPDTWDWDAFDKQVRGGHDFCQIGYFLSWETRPSLAFELVFGSTQEVRRLSGSMILGFLKSSWKETVKILTHITRIRSTRNITTGWTSDFRRRELLSSSNCSFIAEAADLLASQPELVRSKLLYVQVQENNFYRSEVPSLPCLVNHSLRPLTEFCSNWWICESC